MKKRMITLLFTVITGALFFSAVGFAEDMYADFAKDMHADIYIEGDFEWYIWNGACTIKHYRGPDAEVIIPDKLGGMTVSRIGYHAFYKRIGIKSITIPVSVTRIEHSAFESCMDLIEIKVAKGNPMYQSRDGVLFDKELTTIIRYPQGKVGAYTIPDGVTTIGPGAFESCTRLDNISIADSVTTIGHGAFFWSSLESVIIPDSVITIENTAFMMGWDLTRVTIGKGVTHIGGNAFAGNPNLMDIQVDTDNPAYQALDGVLFNKALTKIVRYPAKKSGVYVIPEGVTTIGDYAFDTCSDLTRITIPNSVTSIGEEAFSLCFRLENIAIPDSVTEIGKAAFSPSGLKSVTIPDRVINIRDNTFRLCEGLESVTIGKEVTTIGDQVFEGTGLISVTVPDSVISIGERAFAGCRNLENISIGNNVTNLKSAVFQNCTNLTSIYFKGDAPTLGNCVFTFANENATVYYLPGATGWGESFGGLKTAVFSKN